MGFKKMLTGALLVACGAVVVPGLAMAAINASNSCHNCDSQTGDAHSSNSNVSVVGQNGLINLQDGDNKANTDQNANALTGDANSGQVVGSIGDGSGSGDGSGTGGSSINAANSCQDCDSQTGDAHADNSNVSVVGQNGAINVQDGNNKSDSNQTSNATSGDGNSGQVIGQSS